MTGTEQRARRRSSKYEDWLSKDGFSRHELALLMAGLSPDWPFSRDILNAYSDSLAHEQFEKQYGHMGGYMEFFARFKEADDLIFRALHIGTLRDVVKGEAASISRLAAIRFVLECEAKFAEGIQSEGGERRYRVFLEAAKSASPASGTAKKTPTKCDEAEQDSSSGNWKMQIQEEAARRWKQFIASGAAPSKNNLKDDLAKWCGKQGITGIQGKPLSGEYIRRHVLKDWMPPT